MISCGLYHVDEQRLDDQVGPIYNSSVPMMMTWRLTGSDWRQRRVARKGQRDPCWQYDLMMMIMISDAYSDNHLYVFRGYSNLSKPLQNMNTFP